MTAKWPSSPGRVWKIFNLKDEQIIKGITEIDWDAEKAQKADLKILCSKKFLTSLWYLKTPSGPDGYSRRHAKLGD